MPRTVNRSLLDNAKNNKNDEFYTQFVDIERELKHYKEQFAGKVIYCNCDDPYKSNFFKYFALNFNHLKLKKLVTTYYTRKSKNLELFDSKDSQEKNIKYSHKIIVTEQLPNTNDNLINIEHILHNPKNSFSKLEGNGDFRSNECLTLLKEADIVVTNPPFSLFREYIDTLVKYSKKFLIISPVNALTYKNIYPLIKENKIWVGINLGRGISGFIVPEYYELYGLETKINEYGERIISPNNCMWLTNLNNTKRQEFIPLTKKYIGNEFAYPRYCIC
ncbi:MAG: adenine-specific methyltransferase EcoRI family protein [Spirochaetaceae bacterium]|nr:adenine-specific methyltransferase EcoRI family protein [Spirochaetaceae bacterium]